MSPADDTGHSDSDGVTRTPDPQFEWTRPADLPEGDNSGTQDFYQWAVTDSSHNPWDGPRICEGFAEDRYQRSCVLSDGGYTFWAQARDNAENWSGWAETPFRVDTDGPYSPAAIHMSQADDTGQSDSDGITYIGNPLIEWTAPADRPDGNNAGTQDFYQWAVTNSADDPWDGPRNCEGFTEVPAQRSCILSDGAYKFWVQARDNADNWGEWGEIPVRIDTVDPSIPTGLANPDGSPTTTDTTPNVTWSGEDDPGGSGIWSYIVEFLNGPGPNRTFPSGDTTLDDVDYGAGQLEEGAWDWHVMALDVAGNDTGWSTSKEITIEPAECIISWSPHRQIIDGFGASSAWTTRALTDAEADMFFSPSVGIGLSLLRNRITPLGGTDELQTRWNTWSPCVEHALESTRRLEGQWICNGRWVSSGRVLCGVRNPACRIRCRHAISRAQHPCTLASKRT